jgi:rhodanese-related sulfurtransferase/predicted metal-dependent enzyme (double-stranded beta helix superfamily)
MVVMQQRYQAIKNVMERIAVLSQQLSGESLRQAIAPLLVELGNRSELFPPHEFPVREGKPGGLYQLWRGKDGDLALYASAGKTGKKQPPHDHTTWAVIAGVFGEEHNVFFDRIDDLSQPGIGKLKQVDELTVVQGNAAQLSGDIFHTIEVVSEEDALHLHLYGRALDTLSGRINFESEEGGTYSRFMAVPETYAPWIKPDELYAMLTDGMEYAILDVRENGVYTQGHLFHAASMPLSIFELRFKQGLPSLHVRIVLIDDSDGLAEKAARVLHANGYHNVSVLKGGQAAWTKAGLPVYTGVFVPSKAFGEIVEHEFDTPHISAIELESLRQKQDVLILDSRTLEEFNLMSIPGAMSCPGGELVARAHSHQGPIVVNCAGRTRSIIGAQSLINAGVQNVHALENGTMGQHLAGLPLARGKSDSCMQWPIASSAVEAAGKWARRLSLVELEAYEVREMLGNPSRTTYFFDVRDPSLSLRMTLPQAIAAPGGQLVQQTDQFVPVRNARLIVFDTDGVQAPMTAGWLYLMGWEVYVYRAKMEDLVPVSTPMFSDDAYAVTFNHIPSDAWTIDVGDSRAYRRGHLPGAAWSPRSRVLAILAQRKYTGTIVFTCPDGRVSRLCVSDAKKAGYKAYYLSGGTAALQTDQLTAETPELLTEAIDVWYRPYDREHGVEEAMRQYLSWETGLLTKVRNDRTISFRL